MPVFLVMVAISGRVAASQLNDPIRDWSADSACCLTYCGSDESSCILSTGNPEQYGIESVVVVSERLWSYIIF